MAGTLSSLGGGGLELDSEAGRAARRGRARRGGLSARGKGTGAPSRIQDSNLPGTFGTFGMPDPNCCILLSLMVAGGGHADELSGPSTLLDLEVTIATRLADQALQAAVTLAIASKLAEEKARDALFASNLAREKIVEAERRLFHAENRIIFAKACEEATTKYNMTAEEEEKNQAALIVAAQADGETDFEYKSDLLLAAEALWYAQLEAAKRPSPQIERQMWQDHLFLQERRVAVLHCVHPRVGQHSSMRILASEILHIIVQMADPFPDALTAKSLAVAVVAADPSRAALDGPLPASLSGVESAAPTRTSPPGDWQAGHHAGPSAGGVLLPPSAMGAPVG